MIVFLLWVVVLVAALALYYRQIYSRFSKYGVKQKEIIPFFGNMLKITLRMEHFADNIDSMYNDFPDERFVGRFEFSKPAILIRDLELIKKITIKDFEHFLDHRGFVDDKVEPLFARNLFSLKGQEWKDMRSTLSPAFTSSKIKQMVPFMEEVGEMMIRAVKKNIENSKVGQIEIDVKDLTSRYSNDVIASCAFGLKVDSHTTEDNEFYEMGKKASTFKFKQMLLFFLNSALPFVARLFNLKLFSKETTNFFVDLVQGTMKEREDKKIIRPDMIHLLMEAKKGKLTYDVANGKSDSNVGFSTVEESDLGQKPVTRVWSDSDLIAQAVMFFITAFETISTVASFTLYELAVNPDVQEKLLKEVKEHNAKFGGKLDFTSIQNLTYLDMVVSEVLRLWPPAIVLDRVCNKDYNLGKPNSKATQDFFVRKGELVGVPVMSIHRDPQYFQNPTKFDPERFSEENRHLIDMILEIWVVVLFVAAVLYYRQVYSRFTRFGVKQQTPFPFLGNMLRVTLRLEHLSDTMNSMYKQFPEERFIGRFDFIKPCLFVRDIELIKKITIKDFEHFVDRSGFSIEVDSLFSRNLFSLKGQEWKDMRSTLSPAFTSSKIKQMVPFMEEVGEMMIQAVKNKIKNSGNEWIEIDCKDLTTRYTNDVIASCAFGIKVDSHTDVDNEFYKIGKIVSTFRSRDIILFLLYSAAPFLGKFFKVELLSTKTRNFFIDLVLSTMKQRETHNIIRPDMIHLLMEAKKGRLNHEKDVINADVGFATVEESEVGQNNKQRSWSDTDLIAQAVLFFIAAFEVVSTAMTFTLTELALHPEVKEKLVREIKEHDEKYGGKLDLHSIQTLTYLDMVISEVLRLWVPTVLIERMCVKDYNMGKPNREATEDFILRKGESLQIPTWCIHRDPQFFPNPTKFDPERFSKENRHLIHPIAYMPFGLGPRNCIGSRFALCELKVLVYQILLNFDLSPTKNTCIPARLNKNSFHLRLEGGHALKFRSRQI
ncbi:unnamed protein product [Danaus chrysippus]|uniref:unspecific monooxygenase n=1 Tax=Danaus chrysippus TaxID=151541 RepID=A0A8J2RBA5_9NEOP|nr:unnamed protein product [Danaus chrysippus]